METIIVATDFSASSVHALDYAAALAADRSCRLLLVHVYDLPFTYTGDGLSLYTINDGVTDVNARLQQEQERVQAAWPGLTVSASLLMGGFRESLSAVEEEVKPVLIIMAAGGMYTDLWQWDDDWLDTITGSACPVLVVPQHISYTPFRNVAFACDYKRACTAEQARILKAVTEGADSKLHVIHVTAETAAGHRDRKMMMLRDALAELSPEYHFIEGSHVVREIARFVQEQHIDLLLVTPHRHGLWYNLFHKSYSRQLARFNTIPVITIPDR